MLAGAVSNRNTFVGAGDVWSSTGWRTLDHCLSDLFGTAYLRFCWREPGRPRNTAAAASSAGPGVRGRDCESADRRLADCSPGAGGCALVHSGWCRVALCLRIPSAHKRRRSWSTFVEQHGHRIRRRGRAPRIPVSKHRAALLKEGDVYLPVTPRDLRSLAV